MYSVRVRSLNSMERFVIYEWLRGNNVDTKRIHREFSDVYPIAELMQKQFPRQIDLNNYPKRNGVTLKICNWETFNFKVLSKFNMVLPKEFIEELAKGILGTIEVFLYEMLRLQKRKGYGKRIKTVKENQGDQIGDHQSMEEIESQVMDSKESGDDEAPSKMILYNQYEDISRQCQAKDSIIYIYELRLSHLETMLRSKSERLNQILQIINSLPNGEALTRSSFMNLTNTETD